MNPIGVTDYTSFYGVPPPEDSFELLRPYATDLIVLYLSKINVILFHETDVRRQAIKIFEHVFIKPGSRRLNYEQIVEDVFSDEHQVIFVSQSISYLIKASLSNYRSTDDSKLDLREFNRHIFDSILIYNGIVYQADSTQLESYEGLLQIAMRQQNYLRDLNALLYTAPIKFLLIRRYFESSVSDRKILESFQQRLGLGDLWNFAKTFMDLIQSALREEHSGKYIFDRGQIPSEALELFSFDKRQKKNGLSIHMDVIPRPFYQLDDQNMAVIDFSYFRYILDQGIFWCIWQNSYLKDDNVAFSNFRAKIGKEYFEHFLVGNLLKSLFDRGHQVVTDAPPFEDFWIRPNQKDLIIIEVKMADLNPLTSEKFDTGRFQEFIIANYAKPKDKKGGAKGAYQLIAQLRMLEKYPTDKLHQLKIGRLRKLNVFPVIIYSDQILDVAGVNDMVRSVFDDQLKREEPFSFSVKPLTMIGINTLLEQFSYLKADSGNFLDLIRSYHKYIKGKQQDYLRYGGPFLYYQQNVSFAEYVGKVKGRSKEGMMHNIALFKKLINAGRFGKINKPIE